MSGYSRYLNAWLTSALQYYRALPLSLKALGIITLTVPVCVIQAERDGLAFERAQWHDIGKLEMDAAEAREHDRIARLDTEEKFLDWARRRRYVQIV